MRGYVQLASFNDLDNYNLDKFKIKLQIVLSTKKGIKIDFIHVPHLAPSSNLYRNTMYKWKKLKFSQEEKEKMSKGKTGTWFDLYEEKFIEDSKVRNDFKRAYNRLKEHLEEGRNIILVCYCEDVYKCHRRIIGDMLVKDGYDVKYE